jgi:hypothetical protein
MKKPTPQTAVSPAVLVTADVLQQQEGCLCIALVQHIRQAQEPAARKRVTPVGQARHTTQLSLLGRHWNYSNLELQEEP